MKKKYILLSLLVLTALLLASCASPASEPAQPAVESEAVMEEKPADEQPQSADTTGDAPTVDVPAWFTKELTDVNTGMVFKVADFQGKVILVETMATWCSKCLSQQKEVARLHDILGDRNDFVSLGIDIDPNEDVSQLTGYVKKNVFDWLYIVASDEVVNEISALYGNQYLNPPSTPMLIIDKQGEEHLLPFGIKSAEDLQNALQPFFDEA